MSDLKIKQLEGQLTEKEKQLKVLNVQFFESLQFETIKRHNRIVSEINICEKQINKLNREIGMLMTGGE